MQRQIPLLVRVLVPVDIGAIRQVRFIFSVSKHIFSTFPEFQAGTSTMSLATEQAIDLPLQ
eukprot:scaffold367426_cov48-Prasinocladus_malaysianus.AAC.1